MHGASCPPCVGAVVFVVRFWIRPVLLTSRGSPRSPRCHGRGRVHGEDPFPATEADALAAGFAEQVGAACEWPRYRPYMTGVGGDRRRAADGARRGRRGGPGPPRAARAALRAVRHADRGRAVGARGAADRVFWIAPFQNRDAYHRLPEPRDNKVFSKALFGLMKGGPIAALAGTPRGAAPPREAGRGTGARAATPSSAARRGERGERGAAVALLKTEGRAARGRGGRCAARSCRRARSAWSRAAAGTPVVRRRRRSCGRARGAPRPTTPRTSPRARRSRRAGDRCARRRAEPLDARLQARRRAPPVRASYRPDARRPAAETRRRARRPGAAGRVDGARARARRRRSRVEVLAGARASGRGARRR